MGRLNALFILGFALIKSLFARMMGRRSGLTLFAENYREDRLPPIHKDERLALPRFSACIQCGRCDIGEGARMASSRGAYPGLMQIVLASSRSMPDFDAASKALAFVPDSILAQKESICPTRIPFRRLAAFVRDKLESTS